MKFRRLGKTELQVSVIGIGTWQYGGEWGRDYTQREVDSILAAAAESGINLIDTAECYGDHLSESLVGRAIQSNRSGWLIATKFGHHYKGFFDRDQLWSAEEVKKQLEDSLRALKLETIHLYQFHSGNNEAFDNQDLWTMLDKQVRAGKILHLGISVSKSNPQYRAYQTERATEVGAGTIQMIYNRLDRSPEEDMFPSCIEQDLGVLARVPLASGFLSGKYGADSRFDAADIRSKQSGEEIAEIVRQVEKIKEEVPAGVSMASWALAWCLKHPAVSCVIPGCKSPDQVRQNTAAVNMLAGDHRLDAG